MISARMPTANDFSAVVLFGRCKQVYHEMVQCSFVTMFILSTPVIQMFVYVQSSNY